ncbi:MAG: 16S rRNA (guanine(527)-N(7))-methyltransferase RsmG [Phycisphaeraceae bacterium]|nr:16S rRNA (guanine(527)-N(7))-methyltransferase RsmG [Phycisphaeraceae bacterium]
MIPCFVHDQLCELDIELTPVQLDQLDRYLALVLDENRTTNLTAIRDPEAAWHRLIIDSLTVLPGLDELDPGSRVIDVGSGAGLPGLPVAIARPNLQLTMLESTGKKADFIRRAIEALSLDNATVLHDRAETAGQSSDHREAYDACINRAVGPMNVLLEFALPLVQTGGRVLAMKGPRAEQELEEAGDALTALGASELAVIDAYPESFDNDLVIVSIIKGSSTPPEYPRLPGVPKKDPL